MSQTELADLVPEPRKASFRGETIPALKGLLKSKWIWVLAFGIISGAGNFLFSQSSMATGLSDQLKANPNLFKQHPELLPQLFQLSLIPISLQLISTILASYGYTVFYLQHAAKKAPPQFSVKGFLYWLWKNFQKFVIIFLLMLIPILIVGVGAGVAKFMRIPAVVVLLVSLFGAIGIFVLCFWAAFRFYLVTPLAILGRKPVLKTSRLLTKGQCWRIFWGIFILFLCIGLMFLIPEAILYAVKYVISGASPSNPVTGVQTPIIDLTLSLVQGLLSSILLLTSAVYQCTVYRLIMREQKPNTVTTIPAATTSL